MNVAAYRVESREADWKSHELGSGFTIPRHGGYHAIPPQDQLHNARTRISQRLEAMGVPVKYHHHEVGGPGQCEIETRMLPMVRTGDATLLAKYVARMTAREMGMTATFMPKPLFGEAGSGLHFHQQVWKNGTNVFYDAGGYGCLGQTARFYIGGLLAHGAAVMAITIRRRTPTEAGAGLRGAGERHLLARQPQRGHPHPQVRQPPDSARLEFRPPDATTNPYLAVAAQLMAGIDGIRRRLDPTTLGFGPMTKTCSPGRPRSAGTSRRCRRRSSRRSTRWSAIMAFLLEGSVFSEEMIHRWISRKRAEERAVRDRPHPYEIELYYDSSGRRND